MVEARNESRLLALARGGDLVAFERLIEPYEGRVYRVLVRMVGNEADAEDLLQEALIKAFRRIEAFEGRSAFATWLHRIAVNEALMWRRKRRADPLPVLADQPRFDWMDAHVRAIVDWSEPAEDAALRSELRHVLSRVLFELPELDRAIVLLKDAEGLAHDEIAEVTGLRNTAARSRLHRARLFLRERLATYMEAGP